MTICKKYFCKYCGDKLRSLEFDSYFYCANPNCKFYCELALKLEDELKDDEQ